jgi:hypothetical protein
LSTLKDLYSFPHLPGIVGAIDFASEPISRRDDPPAALQFVRDSEEIGFEDFAAFLVYFNV